MTLNIYTDGSATKSRSGWGFVVVSDKNVEIHSASGKMPTGTTNQACELKAAIEACRYVITTHWDCTYNIYSDSAYLVNCYKDLWYKNWQNNGWVNSKKEPVANQDLWEQLVPYFNNPNFNFIKVKGHAGNPFNEKADHLATGAISGIIESEKFTPQGCVVEFDAPLSLLTNRVNLTNEKNYDTIKIKLSEILIEFQLRNNYQDTINKIIEVFERN